MPAIPRSVIKVFRTVQFRKRNQSSKDLSSDEKVVIPLHTYLQNMDERLQRSQRELDERLQRSQRELEVRLKATLADMKVANEASEVRLVASIGNQFRAELHRNNALLMGYIFAGFTSAGAVLGYFGFYVGHNVL